MITKPFQRALEANTDQVQRGVLRILLAHYGKDNAITDEQIAVLMGHDPKSYERIVRLAINALRREHRLPICSEGGRGYWLPTSLEDAKETAAQFQAKARNHFDMANCIEEGAIEIFGAQSSMGL